MKKLMVLTFLSFFAFSSISLKYLFAAEPSSSVKIGVVDFERALNEVNEGKRAKQALKSEFESKKKELESMEKELKNMKEEIEKQRMILSADALKAKTDTFQEKFRQYQLKTRDYSNEMARKETTLTKSIIEHLRDIVTKIAKSEGYTFVFEKSQGGVVVGPSSADLTDRVIKEYNASRK